MASPASRQANSHDRLSLLSSEKKPTRRPVRNRWLDRATVLRNRVRQMGASGRTVTNSPCSTTWTRSIAGAGALVKSLRVGCTHFACLGVVSRPVMSAFAPDCGCRFAVSRGLVQTTPDTPRRRKAPLAGISQLTRRNWPKVPFPSRVQFRSSRRRECRKFFRDETGM